MPFRYDLSPYRLALRDKGYVHLKKVLNKDFVAYLSAFHQRAVEDAATENISTRVAGKKRQFVFNFPSEAVELAFRAGIAHLTGMAEDRITVSERHLKVYDAETNPWPAPHKDRAASRISIGLPIHLPPGSTVCIFPEMDRTPNPNQNAIFLTQDDRPGAKTVYETEKAVFLNEQVGDLLLFNGSSIFHERVRAAGTAVLYIKINDQGEDPLGEDIYRVKERERA